MKYIVKESNLPNNSNLVEPQRTSCNRPLTDNIDEDSDVELDRVNCCLEMLILPHLIQDNHHEEGINKPQPFQDSYSIAQDLQVLKTANTCLISNKTTETENRGEFEKMVSD